MEAHVSDDDIDNMDFLPDDMRIVPVGPGSAGPSTGGNPFGAMPGQPSDAEIRKEIKSWVCIYPIYFDATRAARDGRRVPKDLAIEDVNVWHLAAALQQLNLPVAIEEPKTHPRDPFRPGRVRTQIKLDGRLLNRRIPNRKTLFLEMAKLFPSVGPAVAAMVAENKQRQAVQAAQFQQQMKAMMPQGMPGMPGMSGMPDMGALAAGMSGMGGMPGMEGLAGLLGGMGMGDEPPSAGSSSAGGAGKAAAKKKGKKGKK
ncbi:hypothetical protein AMAG_17192 [Allomyces macrogynus ATCC 38327]|uniref:Signal recognition particle subunit SRP19 n=1 Tax=Allomyces macrogynus (strain ATCC 38327) TaxID=578462 RepID=A0A0L0TEI4_ALLM3|nr:hypothetical protein AMAG_17192 [Allomyces macrogynus ATCC 38327]|eukprot:KNE72964.1 hypothetical protein AMAG_17192 [Allomyces macrogynus ATCC 38327]